MLPPLIHTEEELDDLLTRPQHGLVEFVRTLSGSLLVLGAGGKMGPTLAVLARRAAEAAGVALHILAVSRFSDPSVRGWLEAHGVKTIRADLLDREAVARLPDASHLIYLVGLKFGTTQQPAWTWAANTLVPSTVAERYRAARIVTLSTGNVYPLSAVTGGGSREEDPLTPLGEYANAAVARERIFEFHSERQGTRVVLLRLNYALDLRYGVLVDLAQKVWEGQAVDLRMGYVNCIWQGDANDLILRSLELAASPAVAFNLTSLEHYSVRHIARRFGELLDRPVQFSGQEADTALLSNSARLCARLGPPPTPLDPVMQWTAEWVRSGGRTLNRPTHFEEREGKF
jgi:nucleoside-diphosphate-sugar epimerase